VQKAAEAVLAGRPFSFIEEGPFTGMSAGLWNVHWTFPMILRRSLFVAVCSHTEHVLRRWSHHLRERWAIGRKLGRPKDGKTDIQNCMEYLRDEVKLGVDGFEQWPEWIAVDTNRLIRNLLTHDGGIVLDDDRGKFSALSYIEVDDSELVSEEPMLNLLPGAPETAAKTAKEFFERLTGICGADPRTKTSG
jgi:hypothetical protein